MGNTFSISDINQDRALVRSGLHVWAVIDLLLICNLTIHQKGDIIVENWVSVMRFLMKTMSEGGVTIIVRGWVSCHPCHLFATSLPPLATIGPHLPPFSSWDQHQASDNNHPHSLSSISFIAGIMQQLTTILLLFSHSSLAFDRQSRLSVQWMCLC